MLNNDRFSASKNKDGEKIHIVLSSYEWSFVKRCVDTNGYCKISDYNIILSVTNDVYRFPQIIMFPPTSETYHPDKKTDNVSKKSRTYAIFRTALKHQ